MAGKLGLRFRGLDLDYLPAVVAAAGRANIVGQLGAVALRAGLHLVGFDSQMTSPCALPRLGIFLLW